MSIIRVKRSGSSGSPAALAQGEMAYSFLGGSQSNGGDRLYVGTGTETGGVAANIEVIGGKYFTSKLSHVPGTLTANAAVIVDGSGRVDTFAANTFTTRAISANGSLGTAGQVLASNGTSTYWVTGSTPNQSVDTTANVQFRNIYATGNVAIDGTLTVGGSTTIINATNLSVADNMIYLNNGITATVTGATANGTAIVYTANNNYSTNMIVTITGVSPSGYNLTAQTITAANSTTFTIASVASPGAYVSGGSAIAKTTLNPDLGFAGAYFDGTYAHAGIFRDATDGYWKFFNGYTPEPDATTFIDTANTSFTLSTVQANTFIGAFSGVATSANTLTTARTINGTSFNGSADITLTANTTQVITFNNGGGGAVSGTTFNGGTAQTISYNSIGASPLAGSTSLVTLGTISSGTWNATLIGGTYGGTGVNNGAKTITIGGNISTANSFTTTGNFALSLTTTAATSITLPTTGTLATLTGAETLTNKTLTLPTIGGSGATFNGSTSGTTTLLASATAGSTTITLPSTTGTVITTGDTSTVTNTMLAGSIATSKITGLAASATTDTTNASNISSGTLAFARLPTLYHGTTAIQSSSASQALTGILSVALPGSTSGTVTLQPAAVAGTVTITLPATTGTVITTGDTATVTNTMLAGSIAITKLASSTISGVSLGNNLNTLTFGTGLTAGGASYNGSSAITITAVTANNTALGVASFDSTDFTVTSGAVTIKAIDGGTY